MLYELTDLAVVRNAVDQCRITIEAATGFEVLVQITPLGSPSCRTEEYLQELVCVFFGVNWADVCGPRRALQIAHARHSYCYLSRFYFKTSYAEIGNRIGTRDHATVINSVRNVEKWIATNDPLLQVINNIKQKMDF